MTERERVSEQLKMLSILYYVNAGLHLLGCLGGSFYLLAGTFVFGVAKESAAKGGAPAEAGLALSWVSQFVVAIGVIVVFLSIVGAVCNALAATFLRQHRNKAFSQVVAALTCLNVPLGTILGVFTFVILAKPEAEDLYAEAERLTPR